MKNQITPNESLVKYLQAHSMIIKKSTAISFSMHVPATLSKAMIAFALTTLTLQSTAGCIDEIGASACAQLSRTNGGAPKTVVDEPLPGIPNHMKWARNGKYFLISSQSLVKRVDASNGRSLISFELSSDGESNQQTNVLSIDISGDSKWVALLHRNGSVSVWDASNGNLEFLTKVTGKVDEIVFMDKVDDHRSDRKSNNRFKSDSFVKFQEQPQILAVSRKPTEASGGAVSLAFIDWLDIKSGKPKPYGTNGIKTFSLPGVSSIARIMPLMSSINFNISYGMQINVLEDDGALLTITMLGGKPEVERLRGANKTAFEICMASRISISGGADCRSVDPLTKIEPVQHYGSAAVVAGNPFSMDPEIRLYPPNNMPRKNDLPQKLEISEPAIKVGWSPDGSRLAVGGQGGGIYLYDTKTWKLIKGRE